jgi:hypothetical protein
VNMNILSPLLLQTNTLRWDDWESSIIYWIRHVGVVKEILVEKCFVQICISHFSMILLMHRDCGVYFKRMRAAAEFDEAKEDFEGFISAQGLEW